ncbi:MAG: hypothetical protein CVU60_17915 [Deltaproteobacteria bacterium HGW-Deltaproteobacteria-18]|jgi:hypothetical protein|nr:MAG: hypothetical protein CVU60_17915 [Deltaproteobacteria bacterium HGW-Deltaproteobacteria-18]
MEDLLSGEGRLLEDGNDSNSLRVVEFAGLFVPDEGLVISPPTGGELTVWPNGSYAFTSSSAVAEGIATHYSYVVETDDGSSFIGSFLLGEEISVPEAMHDFQAWSLPELMDVDGAAEALLHGGHFDMQDSFAYDVPDGHHVETLIGPDPGIDDLTRLILDSQSS